VLVTQRQEGGDLSTNNQAGRDVHNTTNVTIVEGVTEERARTIAETVSRETVLREGRTVAEAVINERVDHLTNLIFGLIKQVDSKLFNRFEDPRFLAALTSAQRGYAETGDTELADELASLLVGLASQKVRSRREIFLRQAIEVAKQLTTEHINALSVQTYLANFKIGGPYFGPEWLIKALDTLLSHYYGRVPTSSLDYQYMSSMGVCYADQLRAFAQGPYHILHDRYRNAMYPSLSAEDALHLVAPENPAHSEFEDLLDVHALSENDYLQVGGTARVTMAGARFRLLQAASERILADDSKLAELQLTSTEETLRTLVRPRMLTTEQFREKIVEIRPKLAEFLDFVHSSGLLNYHLLPVGFVLAQHEIKTRAPQLASVIQAAIDKGD
jgi:hypothetical protein